MVKLLKKLNLKRFVALDLETTGLDPQNDAVIEFAAVLFEDGKVAGKLTFLCDPGFPIPVEIETLTGITSAMVAGAPPFETRLSEVQDFIGNHPIVGHNISFDLSFIRAFYQRSSALLSKRLPLRLYDTALLAQTFLFYLHNHKLGTVAQYFGQDSEGAHRAEADAINTGLIFIQLVDRACRYPLAIFQQFNYILQAVNDPNKWLYKKIADYQLAENSFQTDRIPDIDWVSQPNVLGKSSKLTRSRTTSGAALDEMTFFFGDEGEIARHLNGFELRPQQVQMARTIFDALQESHSVMIEAGTGVGKSLAYLVPATLWHRLQTSETGRIVIASNTKTLQEQLFYKEIPFVIDQLHIPVKAVLLKGRSNYICLTRWHQFLNELPNRLHIAQRSAILPIVIWLEHTQTGDIAENNGFSQNRLGYIWREICSEPGYCTSSVCKQHGGCYLGKIRDQAYTADVVVVNHSLLLADSASGNQVLPEYSVLVVDEAHNLEKNAYNYFARSIDLPRLNYLLNALYNGAKPEHGLVIDAQHLCQSIGQASELIGLLQQIKAATTTLKSQGQSFFKQLFSLKVQTLKESELNFGVRKRYKLFAEEFRGLEPEVLTMQAELQSITSLLGRFAMQFEKATADNPKVFEEFGQNVKNQLQLLEEYESNFNLLVTADNPDLIFWYEMAQSGRENSVEIFCTPLDISVPLYEKVYQNCDSTILTSATLQVGGHFDYMAQRTGFDHFADGETVVEAIGSPFRYDRQMAFLTWHEVERRENSFNGLVDLLIALAENIPRGMLALFTSYTSMKAFQQRLVPVLRRLEVPFYVQGTASRTLLLEQFRQKGNAILFGTQSFWEGIDIVGPALQLLVIHKLPFAVPTEPIVEANSERLKADGFDPFYEYYVPEAALRFRQGIGRLIRSRKDNGVVINLDNRIDFKSYGQVFKKSLPVESQTVIGTANLIRVVDGFFHGMDRARSGEEK